MTGAVHRLLSILVLAAGGDAVDTLPVRQLAEERYEIVTSPEKLPVKVREALARELGQKELHMAAAGARFNSTDIVVDRSLPGRRLVAAAVGEKYAVVLFEQGGIARTRHVVVFERTPAGAERLWSGTPNRSFKDPQEFERAIHSRALWGKTKSFLLTVPSAPFNDPSARPCAPGVKGLHCNPSARLRFAPPLDAQKLERDCQAAKAESCRDLADAYAYGRGVSPDPGMAVVLMEKACALERLAAPGVPDGWRACTSRAIWYETGTAGPKDAARGLALLEEACASDDTHACALAGNRLIRGTPDGLAADPARAASLLSLACEKGVSPSCFFLASLHEVGRGVPKDLERARQLMAQACRGMEQRACDEKHTIGTNDAFALARRCQAGSAADCDAQHRR